MIIIALISLMIMPLYSAEKLIEKIKRHERKREIFVILAKEKSSKNQKIYYSSMIADRTKKSYKAQQSLHQILIVEDPAYENIKKFKEYLESKGLKYWPDPSKIYNPYAPVFIPSNQKN